MATIDKKSTEAIHFCNAKPEPERTFAASVHPDRVSLIRQTGNKWANGTILHYYFFESPARWKGNARQKNTVRDAFKRWKAVGIGLGFKEVRNANDAEVRIGFQRGDGHWSYLGRDVLGFGPRERTMNLDNGDNWGIDTALHEIGHTLGFPHEHQNPNAGIEWDEPKVYADLAGPPNRWDRQTTYHNIIRKIEPDAVQGSKWDPNSIMHYRFKAGLIKSPSRYRTNPLLPAPGLSPRDRKWVQQLYPKLPSRGPAVLKPFESVPLRLNSGQQADFLVKPAKTRRYSFQAFGNCDSTMVLFQKVAGEPRYLAGDDDSGEDRNALIGEKLFSDQEYVLRVRMAWSFDQAETALMYW